MFRIYLVINWGALFMQFWKAQMIKDSLTA